jgi:ribonuclease HII
MSAFEKELWEKGYQAIAGVDEVGYGSLAGPVVACACILPKDCLIEGADDSKRLPKIERERVVERITSNKEIIYAFGIVNAETIDRINILQANFLAMQQAIDGLSKKPCYVLIDGSRIPKNLSYRIFPSEGMNPSLQVKRISLPVKAIPKGDSLSLSIAAASNLAKVYRDRMMAEYDRSYPGWGLAESKGYGTKKHLAAIKERGLSPIHRATFTGRRE